MEEEREGGEGETVGERGRMRGREETEREGWL
jgi:hypothetical protein